MLQKFITTKFTKSFCETCWLNISDSLIGTIGERTFMATSGWTLTLTSTTQPLPSFKIGTGFAEKENL
jgi:hypothetical protein